VSIRTLAISVLGLAGLVVPARATLSFYMGSSAGGTAAAAMANFSAAESGLTIDPLTDFTGTGLVSGFYTDSNTGAEFFGFALTGSDTSGAQDSLSVSSTQLEQLNNGGIIQATSLPTGTLAFALDIGIVTGFGGTGNYCIEENVSSYDESGNCNQTFTVSSSSDVEFVGFVSSDPAQPITSVWIGPSGGLWGSETTRVVDFELGTGGDSAQAPEASTLATIGGGLILLGVLRRWRMPGAARSL